MNIHHMGLHLFNFVMWLIIESQSQSTTFCGTRKPVIKICTSDALTDQTSVNIDSSSIPLYYTISCKCTISPSNLNVEFLFTLKDTFIPENTLLKINEIVFDENTKEEDKTKRTILYDETDLIFNTSGMARTAFCLIASESQSQPTTFCGTRKQVIKICTTDALTDQTSVNIDSWSVPLYQNSSCKCTISPSNLSVEFIFTLKEINNYENTVLKINDIVFDANTKEEDKIRTTILYDETDLMLNTSGTARIAVCLIVSSENEVKFNIRCSSPYLHITTSTLTTDLHLWRDAKEDITQIQREGVGESKTASLAMILSTVIGAVLILTAMTTLFIFKIRYRMAKATGNKNVTTSPVESPPEHRTSTQCQNERSNSECPTHPYERLIIYVNDTFDGDMYQQLDSSKEGTTQINETTSNQPYQSQTTSYTNVLSQEKEYYNI